MVIYHVQSGFYYTRNTYIIFSKKEKEKRNTYIKACYYIEYIVMKKKKKNVITTSHVHDDSIKKLIKLKLVKKKIA